VIIITSVLEAFENRRLILRKSVKGTHMDELLYNGVKYVRRNNHWLKGWEVVPEVLQRKLNKAFLEAADYSSLSLEEALKQADKFKASGDFLLAAKCYEEIVKRGNQQQVAVIIPRLSSCYRGIKQPEKSIELMTLYKERYGSKVISSIMFTSVAAAFCDLGKWDEAKKCIDRAYAMTGHSTPEISAVYGRIKAKSDWNMRR